jgi:ABC-2 type transport system permease protein
MFIYNPYGFYRLTLREVKRFLKVYIQTIVAPLLSNLLFLGVFGGALQKREVGIDGVDYLNFLVPGLCVMGAMMSAIQNPASSMIIQKFQNTFQDLNTYPLTNFEKLGAFLSGGTLRGLIVGILTYVASIPFLGANISNPLGFIFMLAICSWFFASIGVLVGLYFENFEKVTFITSIVLTPFIYFGGVFFLIKNLPLNIQKIAYFNPLFSFIDLTRYTFLGTSEGVILKEIIIISLSLIIFTSIAYYFFKKGIGLKE